MKKNYGGGVDLGKKEFLKSLMRKDKEGIAYDISHVKSKTTNIAKKLGYS